MKIYYVKFESEGKIFEHVYKEKENAIEMVELIIIHQDELICFKELETND